MRSMAQTALPREEREKRVNKISFALGLSSCCGLVWSTNQRPLLSLRIFLFFALYLARPKTRTRSGESIKNQKRPYVASN